MDKHNIGNPVSQREKPVMDEWTTTSCIILSVSWHASLSRKMSSHVMSMTCDIEDLVASHHLHITLSPFRICSKNILAPTAKLQEGMTTIVLGTLAGRGAMWGIGKMSHFIWAGQQDPWAHWLHFYDLLLMGKKWDSPCSPTPGSCFTLKAPVPHKLLDFCQVVFHTEELRVVMV